MVHVELIHSLFNKIIKSYQNFENILPCSLQMKYSTRQLAKIFWMEKLFIQKLSFYYLFFAKKNRTISCDFLDNLLDFLYEIYQQYCYQKKSVKKLYLYQLPLLNIILQLVSLCILILSKLDRFCNCENCTFKFYLLWFFVK